MCASLFPQPLLVWSGHVESMGSCCTKTEVFLPLNSAVRGVSRLFWFSVGCINRLDADKLFPMFSGG